MLVNELKLDKTPFVCTFVCNLGSSKNTVPKEIEDNKNFVKFNYLVPQINCRFCCHDPFNEFVDKKGCRICFSGGRN